MSAEGLVPTWLDILRWALAGLTAWLVLGVLVALVVGKVIAFSARERPRHVAPRGRRLLCRPGRPCRLCERAICALAPCCPHCPWDATNDQM